jgi:hypothetical protein
MAVKIDTLHIVGMNIYQNTRWAVSYIYDLSM